MRIYLQEAGGAVSEPESLSGIDLTKCKLLWVDAEKPSDKELGALGDFFGIHPLALETCGKKYHLPKIQEFPNHMFIMWNIVRDKPDTEQLEMANLCMFLGENYFVTIHHDHMPELESVDEKLKTDPSLYRGEPAPLLYAILNSAVDEYFPMVEGLTNNIDKYMESILTDQGVGDLQTIMTLKHRNMALRKTVAAHRDVIMQLARRDVRFIPEELGIYVIDVYDHLVRIGTEVDNNSDLISSSLDIHLNAVSNRMNKTMKRLTTIATIFMPITFLVGVWGMNFRHIPEFGLHYGYLFAWIVLIAITTFMVLLARRKDWF